jgi:hypothetical protein
MAARRGSVNYSRVIPAPLTEEVPMASRAMHCRTCDDVRPFEELPCAEGGEHEHDAECQEWICAACGEAILVAPLTVLAIHVRHGGVAPHQRRAA